MEDSNPRYSGQTFHDRADRVVRTPALGAEAQFLRLNSLAEVTTGPPDMNYEVAKIILESKEDKWNDQELLHLLKDYFNHAQQTLDFCTFLRECLRRAHESQSRIQLALIHFEEERGENVGGEKYVKTLQDLQKFKEAGNPFTDEFSKLSHLAYEQQAEMWQKLQAPKKELDKNLKSAQAWRWVTYAIFGIFFLSALIVSVVMVAIAEPPVATTLAAALVGPIGTVGKWCDSWRKNYQRQLKGKKELIELINTGTKFSINDLETIRVLVTRLETAIESILQNADFALGEEQEEAVKLGMLEIEKRGKVFMETIENLRIQADESSLEIQKKINSQCSSVFDELYVAKIISLCSFRFKLIWLMWLQAIHTNFRSTEIMKQFCIGVL
ncbi:hypothetical protein BT93_H1136 [Corymbia citriodora subsp. variegata]|nr:hypothetical protein BT93_H1136 [Corymbia citriodora subsp. variegata]